LTYIAFRIEEADRLLTVVAALDSGATDAVRFPWATWYHELAPYGEYRKVAGDYFRLEIPETVANEMIDLIMRGQPLPATFVEQLLIET
jgi:hypothetical protein